MLPLAVMLPLAMIWLARPPLAIRDTEFEVVVSISTRLPVVTVVEVAGPTMRFQTLLIAAASISMLPEASIRAELLVSDAAAPWPPVPATTMLPSA